MGSYQYRGSYDETTLQALDKALKDIWSTLQAHDPTRDWERDSELKTILTEKLLALASLGVSDPKELRTKTLQSLSTQFNAVRQSSPTMAKDGDGS